MPKHAVILFNLGGPDSLDAVEPFLKNLFSDPDIFKFPFLKNWFASRISRKRAPKVMKNYERIGGSSPINMWTELQRKMLQEELRKENPETDVFTAMRYSAPFIEDVAPKVENGGYDKIIMLPLYPQYSYSTTGSSFNEWNRCYQGEDSKVLTISSFYDNQNYIDAINERIDEAIEKFNEDVRAGFTIVFSAHGIPVSFVKKGDPYDKQIRSTVELIMKSIQNSHKYKLCFQSKVGPVKWLEPSTENMIKELSAAGEKNLLIVPISFVSDHIETLHEIDIEYRELAEEVGIDNFIMTEGLNDSKKFIEALKEVVLNAING